MEEMQRVAVLASAAFAGWLGVVLSSYLLQTEPTFAQSSNGVVADRFTLVDGRGTSRGSFGLSGGNQGATYFWMADQAGQPRLKLTVSSEGGRPTITFFAPDGDEIGVFPPESGTAPGANVSRVRRVIGGGDGKADQAAVTYGDLEPILLQLRLIMDKLDELSAAR